MKLKVLLRSAHTRLSGKPKLALAHAALAHQPLISAWRKGQPGCAPSPEPKGVETTLQPSALMRVETICDEYAGRAHVPPPV